MPWEIDYATTAFEKLHKSSYYLPDDVKLHIDVALNLSNYIINWPASEIPKKYFTSKFNESLKLLTSKYQVNSKIVETDTLYGHLDLQRDATDTNMDGYISLCPDMYFHEHLLCQIIAAARQINNKYFIITPQTYKMWDQTWDCLVNDSYQSIPYSNWDKGDVYDIEHHINSNQAEVECVTTDGLKWAGWFDFYSKGYYETLVPFWDDWHGYGPYDFFGMCGMNMLKNRVDFQQYLLKNQIIFEYTTGHFKSSNFMSIYKNMLVLNPIPNQRKNFEENWNFYMNRWNSYLIQNKLI